MSKNLLQDVIPIKRVRKEDMPIRAKIPDRIEHSKYFSFSRKEENKNIGKSKYSIWFVATISIVFLLFALSFLFASAKVTIIPKSKDFNLSQNFFASKSSSTDGLSFELVSISGEETKTIPGGAIQDVSILAKGTVVLFNSFSSAPQPLNIDTRLEGSNGKIYKTVTKIVIPGMAKNGTPGSVEVGIYATIPGEASNSTPLDFKIFGFKGTAKYAKFDGRSKGDITGGLVGKFPQISNADKATAVTDLKTTLQDKLLKKATDQIPPGFILFKDAIYVNISDPVVDFVPKEANIPIHLKGTLNGFLFKESDLTNEIVKSVVDKYDGSDVFIPKIKDLVFFLPNKDSISFTDVKNISFNLTGAGKVVWRVDTNKFAADMLSKQKSDFNQIISNYPNVISASLVLRPVWKTSFPEKIKNIQVNVNYPQ